MVLAWYDVGVVGRLPDKNKQIMNTYQERIEARRDLYAKRAENARRESDARYKVVSDISDVIPFGQPILVGHHSERSHRAAISKIDRNMRKSIEAGEKAKYYEEKAENYGTHGISSDDPEAITRLEEKLAKQQEEHAILKKYRKQDPELVPAYMLSNSNGRMRATKKRIEQLKRAQERTDQEIVGKGWICKASTEENRIMFTFDEKPNEAMRKVLKSKAFKWSTTRTAWVRQWTPNGMYGAKRVIEELALLAREERLKKEGWK